MKIKKSILLNGAVAGRILFFIYKFLRFKKENEDSLISERDHFQDHYYLLCHWMEAKNAGQTTVNFFFDMGYFNIAIYGMGELANCLIEDLDNSNIKIAYGIDRDVANTSSRIANVYSLNDKLPEADAIVVTPYYAFNSIKHDLQGKINCPVISLEEVIWSI